MAGRKITLTGDLGSGKSAVATMLAERTGFQRYSTGSAQRALAEKLGISTLELNQRAETDKSIDDQIDDISRGLNQSPDNLVIDSRMAWHFVPSSFKVKLTVDPQVAVDRVMGDTTRKSESHEDRDAAMASLRARRASETARFQKYYGVDLENAANYDLVIDTTKLSVAEVVQKILAAAEAYWR